MPLPCTPEIRAPISVGELIDKITILQIKATRILDPAKAANIATELVLLSEVREQVGLEGAAMDRFVARLHAINTALWDLEDAIRDCEATNDFGPRFVTLARAICRTNDQRAAIKREINLAFGSAIVEEKSYRGA